MTEKNGLAFVAIYLSVLTAFVAPLVFADNLLPLALDALLTLFLVFNLIAAPVIWAPARQAWLRGHLTHPTYNQIYLLTLRPRLARVLRWVGQESPPKGDTRSLRRIFADTLTYGLLDRALLIAVAYPLVLLLVYWATGNRDGVVGGVVILPAEPEAWKRGVLMGLIAFVLFSGKLGQRLVMTDLRVFRHARHWFPFLALAVAGAGVVAVAGAGAVAVAFAVAGTFAVAVAGAFAFAFAGAGAVAGAFAGAGAVAGAFAFAGAGAGAGAGAFAFAFAVAGAGAGAGAGAVAVAFAGALAVEKLVEKRRTGAATAVLLFSITFGVVIGATLFDWTTVDLEYRGLFVFLALLPILNGVLDTLSYATTLSLTQRGLAVGRHAFWLGLSDFLIAVVLFCLLGAVLVLAIGGAGLLAGVPLFDLGIVLRELDDWPTYWWAYAMVFSTILPTALHGIVAAFALQAWVPMSWRAGLARQVTKAPTDPLSAITATFLLACLWMVVLVGPILFIGFMVWSLRPWLAVLGAKYQAFLIWVFELLPAVAAG